MLRFFFLFIVLIFFVCNNVVIEDVSEEIVKEEIVIEEIINNFNEFGVVFMVNDIVSYDDLLSKMSEVDFVMVIV